MMEVWWPSERSYAESLVRDLEPRVRQLFRTWVLFAVVAVVTGVGWLLLVLLGADYWSVLLAGLCSYSGLRCQFFWYMWKMDREDLQRLYDQLRDTRAVESQDAAGSRRQEEP